MRQLKGKPKESNREKKQRKKEFAQTKKQIWTVVVPTLAAVMLLIVAYVYIKSRSKGYMD